MVESSRQANVDAEEIAEESVEGNNMSHHKCNNTVGRGEQQWQHCAVCGGRIHETDCTSRKTPSFDCPGQEYHTPAEMEKAGYGPAQQFEAAKQLPRHMKAFKK